MDVETERLERCTERSAKHKVIVDSGDEGNSERSASCTALDDAKGCGIAETQSANFQEGKMVADCDDVITKNSKPAFAEISEQTSGSHEVPISDKILQERVTFSEENVKNLSNVSDNLGLVDKSASDLSDKMQVNDIVSEKENTPVGNLSHVADCALNGADFVEGQDRRVLSDKSGDSINDLRHGLDESGFLKEKILSENEPVLRSDDIHSDLKQTLINTDEAKLPSGPLGNDSKAHGNNQASELKIPTLEQLDDIKEPEEPDHKDACKILQDEMASKETPEPDKTAEETDGWLYVLGHDRLKKKVIKKGLENTRPLRGQIVVLNCVGHLEDGTEVDKHENLSITLGDGDFIHAFDLCVALMDKGEMCEVVTESRFAYGELGRAPDIPPNAFVSYVIELVDYHSMPAYSTMSIADRIKLSDEKRERGNYLYSRNEFSRSIDLYTKALKALDEDFTSHGDSAEELQQLIDARVKCHNNMAAAQMKVEAWDAAAKSCDVVLKVQPDNVKALFRKGKCLGNKGDISTAIPLLKRALKLEPDTKIIHQELSRLEKKNLAQAKTEKVLYQKMLGTDKEPPGGKKKKKNEGTSSKWLLYVAGGLAAVLVSVGLTAYRYIHD